MKIRRLSIIIFLLFNIFCSTNRISRIFISSDCYAYIDNILADLFNEPFEKIIFIWPTMHYVVFTSQHELYIRCHRERMLEEIKKTGLDIKHCIGVYHNHLDLSSFSDLDINFHDFLRSVGFMGLFGIYYPSTGKISLYMPKIN